MKEYIILLIFISCIGCYNVQSQLVSGSYYKIKCVSANRYIQVENDRNDNGANAVIRDFADENYFKWQAIEVARGVYKFKNAGSGKCLGVGGGSRTAGAGVIQFDDVNQNDAKWQVSQFAGVPGQYGVVNSNSSLYMRVEADRTANGTRVIQSTRTPLTVLVWSFESIPAPVTSVTLTRAQWQPLFNLILATMQLRINNYTPTAFQYDSRNTYKYLHPNDCKLDIGFAGYVVSHTFDLLPERHDPATIYYIDINKRLASAGPDGRTIRITISFEEGGSSPGGAEVLGNCIDNIACGGGMWWANISRMKVDLFLEPIIVEGKISYTNARAVVTGLLQSIGTNVIVENLNNDKIFEKASGKFTDILNRPDMKAAFTEGLNSNLGRLPIALPRPMHSVSLDGSGNLILR